MRGDIARLGRCTMIATQGEDTIKRSKPFKYAYEKEIVMFVEQIPVLSNVPRSCFLPHLPGMLTSSVSIISLRNVYTLPMHIEVTLGCSLRTLKRRDRVRSSTLFILVRRLSCVRKSGRGRNLSVRVERPYYLSHLLLSHIFILQKLANDVDTCPLTHCVRHAHFWRVLNVASRRLALCVLLRRSIFKRSIADNSSGPPD